MQKRPTVGACYDELRKLIPSGITRERADGLEAALLLLEDLHVVLGRMSKALERIADVSEANVTRKH